MAFLSSTTPLTATSSVILGTGISDRYDTITGTIFADQAGTLYIEQSFDGTNWDVSTSYAISANSGSGFTEPVVGSVYRLRYVNGSVSQGVFRLYSMARMGGDDG